MKTIFLSPKSYPKRWWLIDAKGKRLGRLASRLARILLGKENPAYTPNADMGDYVVVINAKDITLSPRALEQKFYARHTKFPSGLKVRTAQQLQKTHPERLLAYAVKGMMPKNLLGKKMFKKLFIYSGAEHSHEAQKPQPLDIS